MVKHGRFQSLSMPKKEIVSILCGSGFGHWTGSSLRGHLALDLLPDLDTKMQRFLSSFESFQSTGHRQMSQDQYQKQVVITLYWLASSAEYRTIGNLCAVGKSTVCSIVHNVCEAIYEDLLNVYVKFLTAKVESWSKTGCCMVQ
jgi:hypothetical protein